MCRDRVILQLRAELMSDLFVNRIDNLFTSKHVKSFRWCSVHLA